MTRPIVWPRRTASPAVRSVAIGSKLDSTPSACSIDSTGRSTTTPAKRTTPSSGAITSCPTAAATSMPRCPDEYGVAGASYGRTTGCGEAIGHAHEPATTSAASAASTARAARAGRIGTGRIPRPCRATRPRRGRRSPIGVQRHGGRPGEDEHRGVTEARDEPSDDSLVAELDRRIRAEVP